MGRGIPLDGYKVIRDYDSRDRPTRTWVKNPDRKHIWELVWDMALDGKSIQAIQLECSTRGFLAAPVKKTHKPRPFDTNRIAQSLDRAAYAGLVVYHGEILPTPGNWPAYVEPDDFHRIREERRARAHTTQRRPGRPVVGYLLAELATCSECGRRMRVETRRTRANGPSSRRYVCQSHREHHRDSAEWCPAPPVDAVEVDRIVLAGIDSLLADADSLRGQLLAGRRAEHARLGQVAEQARADAVKAQRTVERAEARYADALADDEDQGEVLLAVAGRKRREARQATERADAALDALSLAIDEPEGEQADAVLDRVWQALSGRVQDAEGDVRKLNAALREWFVSFTIDRVDPERGTLCVGPILSDEAVARDLRDPERFPSYRQGVTTAGEVLVGPGVLTNADVREPFFTEPITRRPLRRRASDERVDGLAVVVDVEVVAVNKARATEVAREAERHDADLVQRLQLRGLEVDFDGAEVVSELGLGAHADDGDRHGPSLLRAHPRDRHLARGGAARLCHHVEGVRDGQVALRDGPAGRAGVGGALAVGADAPGEQPAPERRPAGDREVEGARHRQELALHSAPDQAVGDLDGAERRQPALLGHGDRPGDHPGGGVGDPDVQDLARPNEVVEAADDLLHRREGVPDVHPVDVDVVGPEPLEAGVDGAAQALAVRAAGVGVGRVGAERVLGTQHPAVPVGADQVADDALALAAGVEVGGVDEVAARLREALDDGRRVLGRCARAPAAPEHHGSQAQLGDA